MRKVFTLLIFSVLVFFGCNQESEITSPVSLSAQLEINWITLPSPSELSINSQSFSVSDIIDGKKGGLIVLIEQYEGGPFGTVKINSLLDIPKQAFLGTQEIAMTCTPEEGTVEFEPSIVFNKDLEITLDYDGVDLTGVNPNQVEFCYISEDGSLVVAEHGGIEIDLGKGKIKVNDARIPHFSRYGFVN